MDNSSFQKDIQRIVDESGLSKSEIASLYVVTVQTVYNWMKGSCPSQAFAIQHGEAMSALLIRMLDNGILPLSRTATRARRRKHIDTILRQVLKTTRSSII